MSKPKVSMVVSNLNGIQLGLLKDCIDSLIKPGYRSWELIVVDNASTDNSVKYLQQRFKRHTNCFVIENPINMYSLGLNLGAYKASGEYLAYFNNDAAITQNYLSNLIKEFEKDPKLAIAQGKLLNYYKRKTIDSAGETMDIYGNPITLGNGKEDRGQFDQVKDILSASGSACMIKRSIFIKLGGYDPLYGIGYEDMDLSLRARRLGYKVKFFPKAIIYHKRAATDFAPFIRTQVKWHFNKNRIITMIKNYPALLLLKTVPITIILYLGITFYEWAIRRNWLLGWIRISSIFWCIFTFPKILTKRYAVEKQGAKSLGEKDFILFASKPLSNIFLDFVSQK